MKTFEQIIEAPLTKEEAIEIADSRIWETWTSDQVVRVQLFQQRLCMPFDHFHGAVEAVLGRAVWTHEFGMNLDGLKEEFIGTGKSPSMQEIINMIPSDKRIVADLEGDIGE